MPLRNTITNEFTIEWYFLARSWVLCRPDATRPCMLRHLSDAMSGDRRAAHAGASNHVRPTFLPQPVCANTRAEV